MLEALVFHPFWCLGAQRKGMVIAMIITKKDLDTKWQQMFRHCKDSEAAKAEVLALFSVESDDEHQWSGQDIYEQSRKIIRKYE